MEGKTIIFTCANSNLGATTLLHFFGISATGNGLTVTHIYLLEKVISEEMNFNICS